VRTLSSGTPGYNPMGYHLGTVWPHDNAVILSGLVRYGEDDAALAIFKALFEAASHFEGFRLPELYCGHASRGEERRPVQYPVACSPQAWASAALPYAVVNLLGLRPDALGRCLHVVRPRLPEWLEVLHLRQLRVGAAVVDLTFRHQDGGLATVDADVREGRLDVLPTSELPPPSAW
jgi:glycogen debranching enzyme